MRLALVAFALTLSAAAPAAAQGNDQHSLDTRLLLASLDVVEGVVGVYELALDSSDSVVVDVDGARFLRQSGLDGAIGAAEAMLLLEMVAALRAEANAEMPLSDEEIELRLLLDILQAYSDDLVEVDGCAEGDPPFDYDRAAEHAGPTLARVRELTAAIREGIATPPEVEEDRP
jgi:hypothetical protein